MSSSKNFLFTDMLVPTGLFLLLMYIFHQSSLDYNIASHFYGNHTWLYRNNPFLEQVLHKGGVKLVGLIFVVIIGVFIFSKKSHVKELCQFVLMSSALTLLLVFALKSFSTFSCPWDAAGFGGPSSKIPFSDMFSGLYSRQHCFPAGHSSGGYAFLSLYFGYAYVYGKRNFYTLLPGLVLGMIFGFTQQARGAHFMSHDFATITLSLFSCMVTYSFFAFRSRVFVGIQRRFALLTAKFF